MGGERQSGSMGQSSSSSADHEADTANDEEPQLLNSRSNDSQERIIGKRGREDPDEGEEIDDVTPVAKHIRGNDVNVNVPEKKSYIVFAGNPGVGKSTILNSIVGRAVFKAGVSFGTGLTTRVQLYETPQYILGDTPGLSDVETCEQAAREISSLFYKVKSLKLFFVVTLEAGRVKPDDLTTMNLILNSIDIGDTTNKFVIVVNKIPHNTFEKLRSNPNNLTKIAASLTLKHKTSRIIFVPKNEEMEDAENIVTDLNSDIARLILHSAPVEVACVSDIDVSSAANMAENFQQQIVEISKANEIAVVKMRTEFEELLKRDPLAYLIRKGLEFIIPRDILLAVDIFAEAVGENLRKK